MKKLNRRTASLVRLFLTVAIGLVLALFSAALTYSTPPAMDTTIGGAAFFMMQSTSTPQPNEDLSEIGSTDGIMIMGFVIALIVVIPIVMRRKSWMESH